MVQLSNKHKAYAAGVVAVGISAYIRPVETAWAIGTPVAIAATCAATKAVYNVYSYFNPKVEPKVVEVSAADKKKLSLQDELKNKEKALDTQVTEMDKDLIRAIKSSKNPAAQLTQYAKVTKMEREWLDKFRDEGINDTAMLTEVTAVYTIIMKAIMPEEEMRKFGEKSVDMLLLAMECNDLRDKIDPNRANSQKFTAAVQQVNSATVTPVVDNSLAAGKDTKHATKVLQQAATASSVINALGRT